MNLEFLVCCVGFFMALSGFSQNDTFVFANEGRIIGEIKKMDRGVLTFKTAYSCSYLKMKWKKVKTLKSVESFLITLADGQRYKIKQTS